MEAFNERRTALRREDDRAGCPYLTPEQMEDIAEKAAVKAVQKMTDTMYREIGKGFVKKFLWFVGVTSVALYFWLRDKGVL